MKWPLPAPTNFAEGQRLAYGVLAAAAGIFCGACAVAMIALLMWGGWSKAEEHTIVVIFGWSLGGFIAAMIAVIVGLLAGGPVGRFKVSASKEGISAEAEATTAATVAGAAAGAVAGAVAGAAATPTPTPAPIAGTRGKSTPSPRIAGSPWCSSLNGPSRMTRRALRLAVLAVIALAAIAALAASEHAANNNGLPLVESAAP